MWQHHYVIHVMRMEQLRADAEREQRWRLDDLERERRFAPLPPGIARAGAARLVAWISRTAARVARRLDERVTLDFGAEPLLRDA